MPTRRSIVESLETRRFFSLTFPAIDPQEVPDDKTVHIPIVADYSGTDQLNFTVTNPAPSTGVTAFFRPATNTFIKMDVTVGDTAGSMTFELFDDIAPDTVRRMLGLIRAGFFDGLTFHRVTQTDSFFIAQGGDPNGDGSGGPGYTFADEFDPSATFTRAGALAMANSGKDTNGSQFFITAGSTRALDFNHTYWGQLIDGRDTLVSVITSDKGTPNPFSGQTDFDTMPDVPVVIQRVREVDVRNAGVLVVRVSKASAKGNVLVTAAGNEGSRSRLFSVTGMEDQTNSPPFLGDVADQTVRKNGALTFNIPSDDADRNTGARQVETAVELEDLSLGTTIMNGNVVTFVPKAGYTGNVNLLVGVKQAGATMRGSTENPFDTQLIHIGVGDTPINAAGDAALSVAAGADSPRMVVARFSEANAAITDSTADTFSAEINWGDGTVTAGRIRQVDVGSFAVEGSHAYPRAAESFPLTVTLTGNKGVRAIVNSAAAARDIATITSRRTLVVNGSDGDDTITVVRAGSKIEVTMNGVTRRFSSVLVKRVQVQGYNGDDAITVDIDGRAVTIDAGAGNDTATSAAGNDLLLGGSGDDSLNGGAGADVIAGGGGRDSAVADDADIRIAVEVLT